MPEPALREVGRASAPLTCHRHTDHPVSVQRDLPGVVILIHGVNDVGVNYQAMEQGLCQGLNERLNRPDLLPNRYRRPQRGERVVAEPDKVYYRLQQESSSFSPVIPFYWGYRAKEDDVAKKLVNGQVVDLHGNRLDRDFAKGGGMFANATSNIPDMFGGGFKSGWKVRRADTFSDDAHPLRAAPERRYMVLAAKRLAALVAAIRSVAPDDTVSIVAHSQGCLISLLAQAFLAEDGARVADCLVLNNAPYGLHEPWLERDGQNESEQQTTAARVATLVNLVRLVTDAPHPNPPLDQLIHTHAGARGRTGRAWSPNSGRRPAATGAFDKLVHTFAERDNRGKVYLYFCPHDMTVGLLNVQGIGTFGVPESVIADPSASPRSLNYQHVMAAGSSHRDHGRVGQIPSGAAGATPALIPVRPQLGSRFMQRVWTWRRREGGMVAVGASGYTEHVLRLEDESGYDAGLSARLGAKAAAEGETRRINAEPLVPPCLPDLHHGELGHDPARDPRHQGSVGFDPIDAAIAVTKGALLMKTEVLTDPRYARRTPSTRELEAELNADKDEHHRCQVVMIDRREDNSLLVHRTETPTEARQRYQDSKRGMPNSYHSAIVANPEHHRWVTAMDVAIGQARALDDPEWRRVFIAIADWRTPLDNDSIANLKKYERLPKETRQLIEANWLYYKKGEFPKGFVPAEPPPQVVRQTRASRAGKHMASDVISSRSRL